MEGLAVFLGLFCGMVFCIYQFFDIIEKQFKTDLFEKRSLIVLLYKEHVYKKEAKALKEKYYKKYRQIKILANEARELKKEYKKKEDFANVVRKEIRED